ncbi:MAG: hypothetical protein IPO60_16495 [Flavobacteriales bacterium]|jgi:hypothetical protein|nr:hypothetical protein [Flavobacteriales bacterium]MBK6893168.1 hypothetical protein [Flavobacteriales bacterium]MBK7249100.1 hypothetical protein [Flavobacteriales bacterium]MBK7285674.1 hypothetical protein [Flavobacteriales bacterium]MBK9058651.1 hypothetical protein [Flavobacteriales bacterium]
MPGTIDMKAIELSFLEGDVVHAHFKNDVLGSVEDVHELFDTIGRERKDRKGLLLVTVGDRSTLTNEARALASGPEGDRVLAADAIVLRDFGHQLAANAFVRHNRPLRPTKLFPDMKSALAWLGEQHHLIETS